MKSIIKNDWARGLTEQEVSNWPGQQERNFDHCAPMPASAGNRGRNGGMMNPRGKGTTMNNKHGNITITAYSAFHGDGVNVTFSRCREGWNIRRLRGPRRNYCLDYSSENTHVCGCRFPIHARWEDSSDRWSAEDIAECGPDGDEYGRGYIRFRVFDAEARREAERQWMP